MPVPITVRRIAVVAAAAVGMAVTGLGVTGCVAPAAGDTPAGVTVYTTENPHGFHGSYLDQPYRKPDVTLTDTSGRPFSLATGMRKPITLVVFVYTNCPDVCPTVLADLASALRRSEPAVRSQTEVLVITTDPERDTPTILRAYLDRFDPSFVGLTGPLPDIKQAADTLGVPLEAGQTLPSGGYEVGHGAQVIAFGPDGNAHLVWLPGTPVGDIRHDLGALAELG
ncbi:MAG: SCO family protein [Sporichthyaceae bacterium]|nr:SCO family protein [Sporichthyaceae bacterium]